jgi:hypothetical protein
VATPAWLRAQSAVEADCVRELIEARPDVELGDWRAFRPSDVARRLAPARIAGSWGGLVDSLRAIYLPGPAEPGRVRGASLDGLSTAQIAALDAELDTLDLELTAGERDRAAGRVTSRRFDLAFNPAALDAYTLFRGRRTVPVRIDGDTPENTRRTICWTALAAADLATFFGDAARGLLARALARRVERWDRFTKHGYSMLPHELLVNGWLPRADLEPPRTQVIVLHPSAGTQVIGRGFGPINAMRRQDVLAVEPIGFLRYEGQFRWYGGASWILAFPTSGGASSGVMLHLGRLGRAAFVWRARDADGVRRNAVLLSLDLYRYLSGVPEKWKDAKDAATARCTQDPVACVSSLP